MKKFSKYVPLAFSARSAPEGQPAGAPQQDEVIDVTLRLAPRERPEGAEARFSGSPLNRADFSARYGAAPEDVHLVEEFAQAHGLTVVESSLARRSVVLRGSLKALCKAFRTEVSIYTTADGHSFRGRSGELQIPKELDGKVQGVFGLDNRPAAEPRFRIRRAGKQHMIAQAAGTSFHPTDIAALYNFPKEASGKGQCIALIELGGGFRSEDLESYFESLGISLPEVRAVGVDGAGNDPSTADSADGEVMLDIEVAGAVAPEARIVVYFAPNSERGFLDAITTALHDQENNPDLLSISWGSAESNWTQQALQNYNDAFGEAAALGVTVLAAAGDSGSADGVNDQRAHVDFPSSSPHVVACGGTRLTTSGDGITEETVWHEADGGATGGGISDAFPLPDYQKEAGVPPSVNDARHSGRGVPDLAGNADPQTGYRIRVDGQDLVIGGTSAVAPLMAGLLALINEANGRHAGFIHPHIYADDTAFRDIVSGDNITVPGKGYKAGTGWDACTGLGVPDGVKLQSVLSGPGGPAAGAPAGQ